MSMVKVGFLMSILYFIASCKVADKDLMGTYQFEGARKTTIRINPDSSFYFVRMNRNPYMHPFDHPGENFLISRGRWARPAAKSLLLTSQRDTAIYALVKPKKLEDDDPDASHFTFYDSYGDTVYILYVQYPDHSITAALHHSMPGYSADLRKNDTLEFHFYGFRPWIFISGQKKNSNYAVILIPEFMPNFFQGREFTVKRNRLIDKKVGGRFIKTNRSRDIGLF